MGSKPNFPPSDSHAARPAPSALSRRVPAFLKAAFAVAASAALISCISDGPNKTGGDYLAQHGVFLQDTLFHLVLKDIPVDTFWTSDGPNGRIGEPDIRHLGTGVLLAGRSGGFTAEPRMTFHISDTAMLDSLAKFDSTSLRLSLYFYKPDNGFDELRAGLASSSVRDTMAFEVNAWDSTNAGISNDNWGPAFARWNGQYLVRQDDIGALPTPSSRDTIVLNVKTAYAATANQYQARSLPHLYAQLLKAQANKHFVHLRIVPLAGPNSDSGASMLRLGGWLGDGTSIPNNPLLLFSDSAAYNKGNAKNRLQPFLYTSTQRAVDYSLRYSGPRTDMLTAKQRGLHVILDRAVMLDSIDAGLLRQGKTPPPRSTATDFDLSYFVPSAKLTLPVDNPRLEGGFPVQMRLITEIDSILGDTVKGGLRVDQIPSESRKTIWYTYEPGHPETVFDEVSLSYDVVAGDLRRAILRFSRDSVLNNDTLFIRNGETKEWRAFLQGYGSTSLVMSLEAGFTSLTVRSYLSVRAAYEDNNYKDPATGNVIEDLAKLAPRFLKPGDNAITLRATQGFQHLLNRAEAGKKILQDFVVLPADDAAVKVDTSATVRVAYPILSAIPPKLDGGRLKVDVDLYLFPLKAR